MVAYRRAVGGGDWSSDGVYQLSIRDEKIVASHYDRDIWANCCLRNEPWRTEPDSSRDHVACDYQQHLVWWRLSLVFLFETKCRGLFSRARESMISRDE